MVKVILNEQHQLLINQDEILTEKYGEGNWEILPVPASGWTLAEMEVLAEQLIEESTCYEDIIIFASPVPALMALIAEGVSKISSEHGEAGSTWWVPFRVLHNDRREKKELPGGKIIMTVAQEGWVIV